VTTIELKLTIEETKLVLRALGELPCRDVPALVANVRAQDERQAFGGGGGETAGAS